MIDINECVTQNGGCEQNCENTIGSYSCSCLAGYYLYNSIFCSGKFTIIIYFQHIFNL